TYVGKCPTGINDPGKTGWVLDQGRIRLCGAPDICAKPACDPNAYACDALRATLKAAGFAAELQGQPPPDLSPQVLEGCDAPAGPAVQDGAAPPVEAGSSVDGGIADAGPG